MPAKVISFINSKGGVAKSTSAFNISCHLRLMRKRVLLIDLDPQGGATSLMGLSPDDLEYGNIGHALLDSKVFKDIIYQVDFIERKGNKKLKRNLSICPADSDLHYTEERLIVEMAREVRLKRCLEDIEDFDFVLIDNAPSLGLCPINGLVASDFYIPVVDSSPLAMRTLGSNTDLVEKVQENFNEDLTCLGVLFTRCNQYRIHKKIIKEVTTLFGNNVFKNSIPESVKIKEAFNRPLCDYAPKSAGNLAYKEVAKELIKRVKKG